MTSTFVLKNLNEQRDLWSYANKGATLGGLEDRAVRINGRCHPDYVSVPIGNIYGSQLCVKKPQSCLGYGAEIQGREKIDSQQGYHRGVLNLYDIEPKIPTQQVNPQYYSDRRMPYDADLVLRDIVRRPLRYSGTGIQTLRTPHQLEDADHRYWEYAYSFTPTEDPVTGARIATSKSQTMPPPKWDLTKLHQAYPVWKEEAAYIHNPQDKLDTTYFSRIV